jgi:hypothetical protein
MKTEDCEPSLKPKTQYEIESNRIERPSPLPLSQRERGVIEISHFPPESGVTFSWCFATKS